jgi:glucose-6-phosphate 1-dehydrogenase
MRGDATLFTRNDEVEAQWRIIDPVVRAWARSGEGVGTYAAGSQGPAAENLLVGDDVWRSI